MNQITALQIRMAKAALQWSNADVAESSGLHRNTINRAENGDARPATLALLQQTFENAGVEFLPDGGVRLR